MVGSVRAISLSRNSSHTIKLLRTDVVGVVEEVVDSTGRVF
jgi:hypothetical protein